MQDISLWIKKVLRSSDEDLIQDAYLKILEITGNKIEEWEQYKPLLFVAIRNMVKNTYIKYSPVVMEIDDIYCTYDDCWYILENIISTELEEIILKNKILGTLTWQEINKKFKISKTEIYNIENHLKKKIENCLLYE